MDREDRYGYATDDIRDDHGTDDEADADHGEGQFHHFSLLRQDFTIVTAVVNSGSGLLSMQRYMIC